MWRRGRSSPVPKIGSRSSGRTCCAGSRLRVARLAFPGRTTHHRLRYHSLSVWPCWPPQLLIPVDIIECLRLDDKSEGAVPGEAGKEERGRIASIAGRLSRLGCLGVIAKKFIRRFVITPYAYPVETAGAAYRMDDKEDRLIACKHSKHVRLEGVVGPDTHSCMYAVALKNARHERGERPVSIVVYLRPIELFN